MQTKEDLWDVLFKLGELKEKNPQKYGITISVIGDISKALEGSLERMIEKVIGILQGLADD